MINGKKVIAIIPARAGSTGCPGKNYRIIHGKPLVIWSVEAAAQSKFIDTIVVSSNCPNVFSVVDEFNWEAYVNKGKSAHYLLRPEELCGPQSKTEDTIKHALACYEPHDIVVLLQPTSPARHNNLVDKCILEMDEYGYDSVFTAQKLTPFMYHMIGGKYHFIHRHGPKGVEISPDIRPMRNDIRFDQFFWHDNGNVYVFRPEVIEKLGRRIGDNPSIVSTGPFESLQIDTEEDFKIMAALVDNVYGDFL